MANYPDDIPNAMRVSDDLVAAGQPTAEQLEAAAAAGVKTVINLRRESEIDGFDEKFKVEGAGMRYVNLPITGPDDFTEANASELDAALAPEHRPALVHCGGANRVGALMACRAFHVHGESAEDALAIGESAGLDRSSPLYEAVAQRLG